MHLRKESEEKFSSRFGKMSKIGKLPIIIKEGVSVSVADGVVNVTGPKGTASYTLPVGILAAVEEGKLVVTQDPKNREQTKKFIWINSSIISKYGYWGLNRG